MEKHILNIFLLFVLLLSACSPLDSKQGSVQTLPESDTVPIINETEIHSPETVSYTHLQVSPYSLTAAKDIPRKYSSPASAAAH